VAFLGGHYFWPTHASAEALVREAREVHHLPIDRCYLVQSVPEPGSVLARYPRLAQPRETRLWTRGDRFYLRSTDPERKWIWGRDEAGRIWFSLGQQKMGARFEPAEVPTEVAIICDVLSMQVETLLDEVLHNFDLEREPSETSGPSATYRIRATPKAS